MEETWGQIKHYGVVDDPTKFLRLACLTVHLFDALYSQKKLPPWLIKLLNENLLVGYIYDIFNHEFTIYVAFYFLPLISL